MSDRRERLIALARQRLDPERIPAASSFLEAYLPHMPSGLLEAMDDGGLLSFLLERLDVLEREPEVSPRIRIGPRPSGMPFIRSNFTVLEIRARDLAFIVKTLSNFFLQRGVEVQLLMHPVVTVVRSAGGRIARVCAPDDSTSANERISHVYAHLSPIPQAEWAAMQHELATRYRQLDIVNSDFTAMLERAAAAGRDLAALPESEEITQARRFLDWARNENFIFLGHALVTADGAPDDALGLLHPGEHETLSERITNIARRRIEAAAPLAVYRTDVPSPVKSTAQLRYVGVRAPGGAERVFVGLLSAQASEERNSRIPIVAEKIEQVMAILAPRPGSYAYKSYWTTLNALPNEDLFYSELDETVEVVRLIHEAGLTSHPRAHIRRSRNGTRISVLAMLPRSAFSAAVQQRVEQYLIAELDVERLRKYACHSDPDIDLVHLHYFVSNYRPDVTDEDLARMSAEVHRLLLSWDDRLRLLLEARGDELIDPRGVFPSHYRDTHRPETALLDLEALVALANTDHPQIRLLAPADLGYTALRTYTSKALSLSDVVPVLNNLGLRCAGRFAARLKHDGRTCHLSSFEASLEDGALLLPDDYERIADLVASIIAGEQQNDRLLRLATSLGMAAREINLLVLYRNYFLQLYQSYRARTVDAALLRYEWAPQLLRDYFVARFDPTRGDITSRLEGPLAEMERAYREALTNVQSVREGEVLERLFDLMRSTVRTNYFQAGPPETIAIKIDSRKVITMPSPRPRYEIYLRNRDMAGCHLRGGSVARGGIRFSDRHDDFRDEVLGLMKTQMAKNSVIVPVGSKGGFVVRNIPEEREAADAWIRKQYRTFIGGLLQLTDNIADGTVRHPEGVVIYDEEDPYLVVAADKGTARFSDTANDVSRDYNFWLDDAFASGGSAGYDHKAMGITARGAWECVKRHFRELGTDIDRQSIRAIGIGDMSGDVFGNGMLLNDKLKLVGAFNHRHIFVDPDPDPLTSYAERKRLFGLPRSAWTDYSPDALSRGGGVYDREARAIRLSPEARSMLGIAEEIVSGPDLIRALLCARVDLLWLGGIGTYVKSSTEAHSDVGDQANESVRVDARQLRVRVVGEGANLGMTALARTEFALAGGLCNTDALDNSAGVNCSDHEVNLKILLRQLLADGKLSSVDERNRLLSDMTDDVAALVLRANYRGSAAVSLEQLRASRDLSPLLAVLEALAKNGILDREGEQLADDDQLIEWRRKGQPIPRNQLSVVLAHAKMALYDRLLASELPDRPMCEGILVDYFPRAIRRHFPDALRAHPLRREIISTCITNALVDRSGSAFFAALTLHQRDLPLELIAERYLVCERLLDAPALRRRVEELDGRTSTDAQYQALDEIEETLLAMIRWWNWNADRWQAADDQLAALQAEFAPLWRVLADIATRDTTDESPLPSDLCDRLALLPLLRHSLALLTLARTGHPLETVARTFFGARDLLGLAALESALHAPPRNAWEGRFGRATERELSRVVDRLTAHLLADGRDARALIATSEDAARLANDCQSIAALATDRLVPTHLTLQDFERLIDPGPAKATGRRRRPVTRAFQQMPPKDEA